MCSAIAKFCANHLRVLSSNYGVKLKSAHAHELVAAFFGYKSKAAMQADIFCSIEKIADVQIFVLIPSLFVDERRKCLEDLPPDLPNTYMLGESMLVQLALEKNLLVDKSFASWSHLAEVLTGEYLQKYGDSLLPLNFGIYERARNIFNKPLYKFNPKIETIDNQIKLIISNKYHGSCDVQFQPINIKIAIELQRIAGHVGYANPKISVIDISSQSNEDAVI